jgi:hypothetical protein
MFCPNCGAAEQKQNTYCRRCGSHLPDLSEANGKQPKTPEERFRLTLVFNLLSAFAGISMAVALLIVHWGNDATHPVIYAAISLFTVISFWQIFSFFNNLNLKKRFVRKTTDESAAESVSENPATNELLPEADLRDFVPASVVENTTKDLKEKVNRSPQT